MRDYTKMTGDMNIKPILFNAHMVLAIIDGRKTVTRRVVKPQPNGTLDQRWGGFYEDNEWILLKEPYRPGDVLWVQETFFKFPAGGFAYKADANSNSEKLRVEFGYRWRPSIHMPREAARIWLRVTDVRAERLQTSFFEPICPIFAVQAEGIDIGDTCRECIENYGEPCCVDTVDEDGSDLYGGECGELDQSRGEFSELWDSTIKPADREKYGWAANPWVWRVEFERCEKPEEA